MVSTTNPANGLINELLNAVDITAGLSLGASVYAALHTNAPSAPGGSQAINEVSTSNYAAYARVPIVRTSTGWTVSVINDNATNPNNISFGQRLETGSDPVATHLSIGRDLSGAGPVLFSSPLIASGATWMTAIADSAGDILGAADRILVAYIGAPTLFSDFDPIEVMQCYDDGLPSILANTTRYYVKNGTQAALATSKLWRLQLCTTSDGTGAAVNFANTAPAHFQLIKAAPITILQNYIPTVAASQLVWDVT